MMPPSVLAMLVTATVLLAGVADGVSRRELTKVGRPFDVQNLTAVDPATGEPPSPS